MIVESHPQVIKYQRYGFSGSSDMDPLVTV